MSATTETLLLQILELENKIIECKHRGIDTFYLETSLQSLKEKFSILNEALNNSNEVLKG